ncbi:MAG: permease, partial [Planctomycetota bacterium]
MAWKLEWKKLAWVLAVFGLCFWLPVGVDRFNNAVVGALELARWYAREHVVLCLVPAFFIAGAIAVFVSQDAVMRYLGPKANKVLAYGVASVSGSILAVCSCTVLPLFAGIYRMGAGIGPAAAFLYSGPAINVLAIILTARVLGLELGIARAVGAIGFGIVIGLIMHLIYRRQETDKLEATASTPQPPAVRPLWQNVLFFASMIAILVFANWGRPDQAEGIWSAIHGAKWILTTLFAVALAGVLVLWFRVRWWQMLLVAAPPVVLGLVLPTAPMIPFAAAVVGLSVVLSTSDDEAGEWFSESWTFTKQIMPLLLVGVLIAGALLGRPDQEGLIPSEWVSNLVGGNSLRANLFASVVGAFMYFATLTEVPILEGLIGNGMGKGPALA